jgi:hypothetical protein
MPDPRPQLAEADLDQIEALAKTNAAGRYRGALLALVVEVRRLRAVARGPIATAGEEGRRTTPLRDTRGARQDG